MGVDYGSMGGFLELLFTGMDLRNRMDLLTGVDLRDCFLRLRRLPRLIASWGHAARLLVPLGPTRGAPPIRAPHLHGMAVASGRSFL